MALGAAAAALVGTYFAYVNLRRVIDPEVIVYTEHDLSRPSVIVLVIENVGRTVAYNVRFQTSRPIPVTAFGIEQAGARPEWKGVAPLSIPVPALAPGAKRIFTWGQYGGLKEALGEDPVEVKAVYETRSLPLEGRDELVTESALEIESFFGTDATDPDGARQSAKHLKAIAETLSGIATGRTKPRVVAYTPDAELDQRAVTLLMHRMRKLGPEGRQQVKQFVDQLRAEDE